MLKVVKCGEDWLNGFEVTEEKPDDGPFWPSPSKVAIQLYIYGGGKNLKVSKHCANLASRLQNVATFQQVFRNEVSQSK